MTAGSRLNEVLSAECSFVDTALATRCLYEGWLYKEGVDGEGEQGWVCVCGAMMFVRSGRRE